METVFLLILILTMIIALGSGFPVAFSLPGSAVLTILLAALAGYLFAGNAANKIVKTAEPGREKATGKPEPRAIIIVKIRINKNTVSINLNLYLKF
jgi:hypothetical protein